MTTESTPQQLPRRSQSGMRTRAVNAAAGVIQAAMEQGRQLPVSLAIALDSARLLNSPEHAAEFERLRERSAAGPADVDAEPAIDLLLAELARNVRAIGRYEGPQWEDPYWCEHIAFLGKHMGPVLRRLLDAEARVGELESEREKLVRWHGEDSKTITTLVARLDRHRARLVALQNDALSMRGSLAPANGDRKVPFELGETLTPAVEWLIARVAELEAAPTTVYRAEHPDSGITLGHYGTEAAARAHCEATERNAWPAGTALGFGWIEDDEDGVAELLVTAGQNQESVTGYIVTALELDSEYDPDGDE